MMFLQPSDLKCYGSVISLMNSQDIWTHYSLIVCSILERKNRIAADWNVLTTSYYMLDRSKVSR